MIDSEIGTVPEPADANGCHLSTPTSTIVRINLITCSLSMACLLSRVRDLSSDQNAVILYIYLKSENHALDDIPIEVQVYKSFSSFGIVYSMSYQAIRCDPSFLRGLVCQSEGMVPAPAAPTYQVELEIR